MVVLLVCVIYTHDFYWLDPHLIGRIVDFVVRDVIYSLVEFKVVTLVYLKTVKMLKFSLYVR